METQQFEEPRNCRIVEQRFFAADGDSALRGGVDDSGCSGDGRIGPRRSVGQPGHHSDPHPGFDEGAAVGSLAGRVGRPEDIADAAVWLLGVSYVSGEIIHVDGGSRTA